MSVKDFRDKALITRLKQLMFKSQQQAPDILAQDTSIEDKDSPYVKGRAAWNELYGSTVTQLENSYRLHALQLVINIALVVAIVHMAGQSKVMPYIVQVDKDGAVITNIEAKSLNTGSISDQEIQNQLYKFILYARGITADPDLNQDNIYAAQALTTVNAFSTLSAYFKENNPLVIDKDNKVAIQVLYENKRTDNSYEIAWTETTTTLNDQPVSQKNFIAEITYKLGDVKDVQYNPLGLYITDISWTEQIN